MSPSGKRQRMTVERGGSINGLALCADREDAVPSPPPRTRVCWLQTLRHNGQLGAGRMAERFSA